jgi:hypothetical protein
VKGWVKVTEENQGTIKDILLMLPPNYPVGTLFVNGAVIPVARFINYSKGLAYFIGPDFEVILIDGNTIDGIEFATEECCEDEEDDFE